jgi:hypothetical protein
VKTLAHDAVPDGDADQSPVAVGTSADGTVTAMWGTWLKAAHGSNRALEFAVSSPGAASFGHAVRFPATGSPLEPQLSVAPDGEAVAAWYDESLDPPRVMAALRGPDGQWSPQRSIAPDGSIDGVAMSEGGNALVALSNGAGDKNEVSLVEARDGSWQSPRTLSRDGQDATVASNARGDAIVAWHARPGIDPATDVKVASIEAVRRQGGGDFGSVESLGDSQASTSFGSTLARSTLMSGIDEFGRTSLAWLSIDPARGSSASKLTTAFAQGGSAWQSVVTKPVGRVQDLELAVGAGGDSLLVWGGTDSFRAFSSPSVYARRFHAGAPSGGTKLAFTWKPFRLQYATQEGVSALWSAGKPTIALSFGSGVALTQLASPPKRRNPTVKASHRRVVRLTYYFGRHAILEGVVARCVTYRPDLFCPARTRVFLGGGREGRTHMVMQSLAQLNTLGQTNVDLAVPYADFQRAEHNRHLRVRVTLAVSDRAGRRVTDHTTIRARAITRRCPPTRKCGRYTPP